MELQFSFDSRTVDGMWIEIPFIFLDEWTCVQNVARHIFQKFTQIKQVKLKFSLIKMGTSTR